MKDITQTAELAVAVASLIRDGVKANSDGKITIVEAVGLVAGNASKCITAANGIKEIPGELKDLQAHEFEELYFQVIQELEWENEADARLVVGSIYDLIRQGLVTTSTLREYFANKAA